MSPVDRSPSPGRQLLTLWPVELRRCLLRWRIVPVVLLAGAPAALLLARFLRIQLLPGGGGETMGEMAGRYAILFQVLNLRSTIFFAAVVLFTGLLRGELLERTLHFYLLAPVRREVLLLGKYLAGLTAAGLVIGGSVAAQLLLAYWPQRSFDGLAFLFGSAGLRLLLTYVGIALLATAAYGALFVWLSVAVKNPLIPAALVLAWEGLVFLLPPVLKRLSVIHYLQSLCPVPVPLGPFALPSEPTRAWLAIPGLLALTAAFLTLAARRLRRLEVPYGGE